jgi:alpha-beta hydrolase superfamily lysophospholipase
MTQGGSGRTDQSIPALAVAAMLTLHGTHMAQAQAEPTAKRTTRPARASRAAKPRPTGPQPVQRLRIEVPCRAWVPKDQVPKVVLLCVHGLGLNSASYEDFGKRMSGLGIATFAVDVRGFGTWMQLKGKEKVDFDACIGDVKQAIDVLHKAYPRTPVFILGESMGGAIAMRFTALYPGLVSGLISAVPSGDRFQQKRTELKVALALLKGPSKPMKITSKVIRQATSDPELSRAWFADPFNRQEISPRELWQFQKFMNDNHDAARQITGKPVLVIQGFKDRLVKPEGTIELFNELATQDKLLVVVGDREHLIFEENQFTEEVVWVVLGWLKSKVERPRA